MRRAPQVVLFCLLLLMPAARLQAEEVPSLTLTILHDNYVIDKTFESEWGFACLLEGLEKTILFDTGGSPFALCSNLPKAGIDPACIDTIVLSHIHEDHVGGFACLLPLPHEMSLLLPASFPPHQRGRFEVESARITWVEDPIEICAGAMTTGEIDGPVIEHALVVRGPDGLIVITGCAHPGIATIVRAAMALYPEEPVDLLLGGFHLLRSGETTLRHVAAELLALGVRRVAPTHCSGDLTREVFKEIFGLHYIEAGVGLVLEF